MFNLPEQITNKLFSYDILYQKIIFTMNAYLKRTLKFFYIMSRGLILQNKLSLVFNDFHYQRVKLNSVH